MTGKVIRFRDYENSSRNPDAVDRDPTEPCTIIILPIIRVERYAVESPRLKKRPRRKT